MASDVFHGNAAFGIFGQKAEEEVLKVLGGCLAIGEGRRQSQFLILDLLVDGRDAGAQEGTRAIHPIVEGHAKRPNVRSLAM